MKFTQKQLQYINTALINMVENMEVEDFDELDDPETKMLMEKSNIENLLEKINKELDK